jgi:hypothetical protein
MLADYLNWTQVRNYSEATVRNRRVHIGFFLNWCLERGLREPVEITRPVLERYQRYLFHYRKKNGEPLSFHSQHSRLAPCVVAECNQICLRPRGERRFDHQSRTPHTITDAEGR